ncbi:hypothetical protein P3X46_015371 [Hevea brasiliensis]|uniref:Uncharacterized protein n=1 Tax=Hevea brasiliensis TaxID=3981 RepID=A0ABQ9LY48_HEVBR|nr:protein PLASTID REDOX INSENSITIVE 2, chloroplastic [Hevea brasiliensis]KAJ9172085.1 hypothetical protein P3X46_015371 [Hevea brasiliensis]
MASWCQALVPLTLDSCSLFSSSTSRPLPFFHYTSSTNTGLVVGSGFSAPSYSTSIKLTESYLYPSISKKKGTTDICRAAEYKFPDPIPEFAVAETEKFRTHLHKKLSKKDIYGDSLEEVVGICTEILGNFLHKEYGGPGTLLVIPFIDMADTINERGLPGGPQAARAAVKWAQDHVDKDWKEWTGGDSN